MFPCPGNVCGCGKLANVCGCGKLASHNLFSIHENILLNGMYTCKFNRFKLVVGPILKCVLVIYLVNHVTKLLRSLYVLCSSVTKRQKLLFHLISRTQHTQVHVSYCKWYVEALDIIFLFQAFNQNSLVWMNTSCSKYSK